MKIGVLALQGAFAEHRQAFSSIGIETAEIRSRKDMRADFDGIVIPGGESTVQGKLLRELGLFEPLKRLIDGGLPVFGTCAGLLLLAAKIENDNRLYFASMNISAVRNAYGRQLGSFYTEAEFAGEGRIPMTFIRAPYIGSTFGKTEVLATVEGKTVAAREGNMLVTAFHPELNESTAVHRYFIEMVRRAARKADDSCPVHY